MSMCAKEPQVLLIDQNAFRRAGYLSLLEDWARSTGVSIKAVTPDDAATNLENLPDCQLVLLNLGSQSIEDDSTRHLIKLLRALIPDTPLTIVSDNSDPREVACAFRAGASGFIPTSLKPSVALHSFTFIMNGGAYFPPSALLQRADLRDCDQDTDDGTFEDGEAEDDDTEEHTTRTRTKRGKSRIVRLTARQHEVLLQLREGKSNKVIARALDMTEATVKVHVRQIMRKLGASNRTQAAVCAVEADLNDAHPTNGSRPPEDIGRDHDRPREHPLHTVVSGAA